MMDDLISRQDVLDAVKKLYVFAPPLLINTILSVPSASTDMSSYSDKLWHLAHERGIREAQQQWIPCSERLPDQNGKYLVVGRQKAINILKFDGGRWYGKWGAVAWMPLPSPYREEVSD